MILAIVAIWAIVIPCVILATAGMTDRRAKARREQLGASSIAVHPDHVHIRATPRCVIRAPRPGRATTRRVCPELDRRRRRSTSA
jgi:hypothetical protein